MPESEFWERQLNPRVSHPEAAAAAMSLWPARAAAARAARPEAAEIAYGPHPRERLDLYSAADPRGTLVFFHGGYWRALSKDVFAWIVEGFVDRGISVALVGYPLCPEVTVAAIVESCRNAVGTLLDSALAPEERRRIVLSGHSAGGHLTAAMLATDWIARGVDATPIVGAVPISGIFEPLPLTRTSINAAIRLSEAEALELTLSSRPPALAVPLTLAWGGDEPDEFHRQSRSLADAWGDLAPQVVEIPGRNHFDVLDGLLDPLSPIHRAISGMIG